MNRWGEHQSVWLKARKKRSLDLLRQDLTVDTVIVGAGITGLTAAYQLCLAGQSVAVICADQIGDGTTGYSTGHLTQILDQDFSTLISDFGKGTIKEVVNSVTEAIGAIEKNVKEL